MSERQTARLEAAAKAEYEPEYGIWDDLPPENVPDWLDDARRSLAAADQWDRANGYVTIRLDEHLALRVARAIYESDGAPLDGYSEHLPDGYDVNAAAVLSVLREAAER